MLYRYLLLSPLPPSYRAVAGPFPSTTRAMRRVGFDRTDQDEQPAWLEAPPTRPVVYATLGTAYNRAPELFAAILAGLRDEPIELIVTVGPGAEPADFGSQPDFVHIHRYVPHSLLLPRCDLVICHGGFGTLLDALAHGLPLVLLPIAADQQDNARYCAELGVGELVAVEQRDPVAIRKAVRQVLSDPGYRANAAALAAEIAALPSPADTVALLEQLAGR
jgi:MGT family glycosyltransferase